MKNLIVFILIFAVISMVVWLSPARSYLYWTFVRDIPVDTVNLPPLNKRILSFVEKEGRRLAPSYHQVVCTDYLINVLGNFDTLSFADKRKISIITQKDLAMLISADSSVIKGVSFYLTSKGKGIPIHTIQQAKAGDFIQFWNIKAGKPSGHCGIVRGVDMDMGLISLYSSSPSTDGYGKQIYLMPKKYYISRMRE